MLKIGEVKDVADGIVGDRLHAGEAGLADRRFQLRPLTIEKDDAGLCAHRIL